MATDIGHELKVLSTNITWVPLETLIPKINSRFKKYNKNLAPPKDGELPPKKKVMTNL